MNDNKKRIACFFTAGYTELNAMKAFLKKINNQVEYIQLCPIGPRKNINSIKNRNKSSIVKEQNGLTGQALIEHLLGFIEKKRFQEECYDAILIEDDKDNRFLQKQPDGYSAIDKNAWENFKTEITRQVHDKHPHIPVIFFFAAPEIESWFLADWKNSFGSVYESSLSSNSNKYFSIVFQKYINDHILTVQYKNMIEAYGYFNGKYKKLSEQIQSILDEKDFFQDYSLSQEHPQLRYSKREQGQQILYQLEPEIVLQSCQYFFKDGFWALKNL